LEVYGGVSQTFVYTGFQMMKVWQLRDHIVQNAVPRSIGLTTFLYCLSLYLVESVEVAKLK
tara:strand:+ start:324 stop:506 length:183 start_codon:yes stop_codon:yes gene_type:complete